MLTNFIYYINTKWEDVWNTTVKKLWEQLADKRYSDILHHWRKGEKPSIVFVEV